MRWIVFFPILSGVLISSSARISWPIHSSCLFLSFCVCVFLWMFICAPSSSSSSSSTVLFFLLLIYCVKKPVKCSQTEQCYEDDFALQCTIVCWLAGWLAGLLTGATWVVFGVFFTRSKLLFSFSHVAAAVATTTPVNRLRRFFFLSFWM